MWRALESGMAGALALTAAHETTRRKVESAPRMDVLGMRAIRQLADATGARRVPEEHLHEAALAGDVVANTLYYSLVALGRPEGAVARGAILGFVAGLGAVFLPEPMGLGSKPSNRTRATQAMTIGLYTLGGVAAGAAYRLLAAKSRAQ